MPPSTSHHDPINERYKESVGKILKSLDMLHGEIDHLKEENSRLGEQIQRLRQDNARLHLPLNVSTVDYDNLKEKNTRLREQLQDSDQFIESFLDRFDTTAKGLADRVKV